jgi:large subunit ribosomal protein L6
MRSLLVGVLKGYRSKLKLVGVGYKARVLNKKLYLKVGYSHEALYDIPEDIEIICSKLKGTLLLIKGKEEQRVRQVAMEIRNLREPDAYKGKGIHKQGELLKLKKGKREGK